MGAREPHHGLHRRLERRRAHLPPGHRPVARAAVHDEVGSGRAARRCRWSRAASPAWISTTGSTARPCAGGAGCPRIRRSTRRRSPMSSSTGRNGCCGGGRPLPAAPRFRLPRSVMADRELHAGARARPDLAAARAGGHELRAAGAGLTRRLRGRRGAASTPARAAGRRAQPAVGGAAGRCRSSARRWRFWLWCSGFYRREAALGRFDPPPDPGADRHRLARGASLRPAAGGGRGVVGSQGGAARGGGDPGAVAGRGQDRQRGGAEGRQVQARRAEARAEGGA